MASPLGKPSDKADRPESHRPFGLQQKCGVCIVALLGFVVRPGLGLAQRGAGRGAEGCVR